MKFTLLKKMISLIANRATKKEMYLEIGAYFIKKGANYQIGEIIYKKQLQHHSKRISRAKVVSGLSFDFDTNKIYVRKGNKIVSPEDIVKG
ncbi:hypothetical protein ACSTS3_19630 [Aquimarina muelleri]|uniref:hypothetical protein n=1 Tax=Aquimarina muelleri TaxID=279356 RepID=UPI003F68471B